MHFRIRSLQVLIGLGLAVFVLTAWRAVNPETALTKLRSAFFVMREQYVEPISEATVVEGAIRGMLKRLDPHSAYLTPEQMQRVRDEFNAGFEGIGVTFERIPASGSLPDTIAIQSVLEGGPSEAAGIQTADRILAVNAERVEGLADSALVRRLRGPSGSDVRLTLFRPSQADTLVLNVTRGRVPLPSLEGMYMIDDRTGYVRFTRFARTTSGELINALTTLRARGMDRLVLDLRGNGGGYMDQAVKMADEFLAGGKVVVSQRGRSVQNTSAMGSTDGGRFERGPVIILVDGATASASEIVSGALQDHDRALIVGQRTFGKGLVQTQRELPDGSALRVTIARYYTPSGRLLQTPYVRGERPEVYQASKRTQREHDRGLLLRDLLDEVPDSLKYRTDRGRVVIGGGGILPDVLIADSLAPATQAVLRRGLETRFVRAYVAREVVRLRAQYRDVETYRRGFRLSEAQWGQFEASSASALADTARTAAQWQGDLAGARTELEALLRARIAERLYGRGATRVVLGDIDRTLQAALLRWNEAEALQ